MYIHHLCGEWPATGSFRHGNRSETVIRYIDRRSLTGVCPRSIYDSHNAALHGRPFTLQLSACLVIPSDRPDRQTRPSSAVAAAAVSGPPVIVPIAPAARSVGFAAVLAIQSIPGYSAGPARKTRQTRSTRSVAERNCFAPVVASVGNPSRQIAVAAVETVVVAGIAVVVVVGAVSSV